MTGKIILERWDAAELFCRVIARFEREETAQRKVKKGYDPHEPIVAQNKIDHYTKGSELEVIWNKVIEKTKQAEIGYPTAIADLARKIRTFEPIVMPIRVIAILDKYAAHPDYKHADRQAISPIGPGASTQQFEGTEWKIFYQEAHQKDKGVVMGIMRFKPFSGAEIISLVKGQEALTHYVGGYKLVGDNRFISLRLKLAPSFKKALQIRIYIGTEDGHQLEVLLGTYTNYGNSMYIGNILMEPVKEMEKGLVKPALIRFGSKSAGEHVWRFFNSDSTSAISIPGHVTSIEKLNKHYK